MNLSFPLPSLLVRFHAVIAYAVVLISDGYDAFRNFFTRDLHTKR